MQDEYPTEELSEPSSLLGGPVTRLPSPRARPMQRGATQHAAAAQHPCTCVKMEKGSAEGLGGRFGYFLFFSAQGRGRGSPRLGAGGRGAGRVFEGILGGG